MLVDFAHQHRKQSSKASCHLDAFPILLILCVPWKSLRALLLIEAKCHALFPTVIPRLSPSVYFIIYTCFCRWPLCNIYFVFFFLVKFGLNGWASGTTFSYHILGLKVYEYYTPICLTDPREERMVFYTNYISSTFCFPFGTRENIPLYIRGYIQ